MVDVCTERADSQRSGDRNRRGTVPKRVSTESVDEFGYPFFSVAHAGSRIAPSEGTSK
jgi:hypothetical protein